MYPTYKSTIIELLENADAIKQIDADTTLLGFAAPGTADFNALSWSLVEIKTTGDTTTRKYPGGSNLPRFAFSEYAGLIFTFRNF